jgi:hypothetical protein
MVESTQTTLSTQESEAVVQVSTPLTYSRQIFESFDVQPRGVERALFRALRRARMRSLFSDAILSKTPYTKEDLWNLLDGVTAGGYPVAEQMKITRLKSFYDRVFFAVSDGTFTGTSLFSPDVPDPDLSIESPAERALVFCAKAILLGADPAYARIVANGILVSEGLDSLILSHTDGDVYDSALHTLKASGNATPLFALMLTRYDEDD